MAENTPTEGTSALPPKLDLRKSGILKSAPPTAAAAPAVAPAPAPVAAPAAAATPPAPKIMPMGAPRPAPIGSPGAAPAAPGAGPSLMRPKPPTPGGLKPLGGSSPSQRPTIGVKPASPAAVPAAPAAAPTVRPLVSKKETARIPLAAAKPRVEVPAESAADAEPDGDAPLSAIKIAKPVDTVRVPIIPKPSDVVSAEKRKTSRISLEAVLSDSPSETDGEGLKTIRLKKPGEAAAATVTAKAAVGGGEDSSVTQRKTVVVKRSAEPAGSRKLTFARPAGAEGATEAAAAAGTAQPDFAGAAPAPHVTFGVLAIVASLVMVVVIYMLCAQVLGPNSSMTRYSYAPGGPNLGWPGKIDRIQ